MRNKTKSAKKKDIDPMIAHCLVTFPTKTGYPNDNQELLWRPTHVKPLRAVWFHVCVISYKQQNANRAMQVSR